jgi:GMP synthase (glutamine-hydrolysing)
MQKAVAIRHVLFEGLGSLEAVLQERGIELHYLDAGVDDLSPAADADLVMILGGSISAYQFDHFPFLGPEVEVIRRTMDRGVPTFGICLGAQLMSLALGSKVYANTEREIGWGPLTLTEEGEGSVLAKLVENDHTVLHWHRDVFDLPEGATRLASTPLTANQAFSKGKRVMGIQFHPELEVNNLERWLITTSQSLIGAGIPPQQLRDQAQLHGPGMEKAGRAMFGAWLDQLD